MEFPVVRRKANTYGKGARKTRVHDLFDVGAQPSFEPTKTLEHHAPSPTQSGPDAKTPQNEDKSNMRVTTVHGTHGTKGLDTATSSPRSEGADPSDTFEIQSSEDNSGKPKAKPTLKKRKVASVESSELKGAGKTTSGSKISMPGASVMQTVVEDDKSRMLKYKSANAKPVATNSILYTSPVTSNRPVKLATVGPAKRVTTTKTFSSGVAAAPRTLLSKELRVSSGSSADHSDASTHSRVSQRSTPKRKRGTSDAGITSPTLSDLHLTSLRLTSGSGSQRSHISSEDEEMNDAPFPTPRRGRARLIDRLDAPHTQYTDNSAKSTTTVQIQALKSSSQPVTGSFPPQSTADSAKDRPVPQKQSSNASGPPPGRARATYAKQRSYLSDMVDSLDNLPPSSSQTSSQPNHSQALSLTSAASQMELDFGDGDEPDTLSQIKSIHELRRGGAVRQSDLDVQSILEDIESPLKSLRVTGLLQLAAKLNKQMFLRHFQDSGSFQRLTDCVKEGLDEVSAILIAFVLQLLVLAENSSPRPLLQILNALCRLPVRLLSETRCLRKVAKDRNQNLSKLLISEITDFEVQSAKTLGHTSLKANMILLGSIESALRTLIGLKESPPRLPPSLQDELLSILTKTQKEVAEGQLDGQIETIQLLLSILEIACANPDLSGSGMSTLRLHELGQAVADIMMEARQSHPGIEQSSLRLIVSLSNNDADVCGALSERRLINTVFQVIDDHFLTLAGLAALEKDFENAQLDSVILAVGCLLNLAECADKARNTMLNRSADGESLVDRLVDIFNSHADQASEALTIDQTQILVAFGYISALLCTLCLNPTACKRISKHIKGHGLSQLFGAADTFLRHLQTVEAALEEDEALATGFTTRFTTVLDTVKAQAL